MGQLFYAPRIEHGFAHLEEEEGRHLLTVLRRKVGDRLQVTDGLGNMYEGEIADASKRGVSIRLLTTTAVPPERPGYLHLAIAPTKQMERLEWCLEKATEIGVDEITLLQCHHSERTTVRLDRLEKVLVSAMKQSLRAWLPQLHGLVPFQKLVTSATETQKRIAWCADSPLPHFQTTLTVGQSTLILIGPEGDFSPEEVALAAQHGFLGVGLGTARLRTETAGIVAVAAFNLQGKA